MSLVRVVFLACALAGAPALSIAQEAGEPDGAEPVPSIEQKTEGMARTDGFIPLYWDEAAGKVWLELSRRAAWSDISRYLDRLEEPRSAPAPAEAPPGSPIG
jgi:hypothetical protein